MFSSMAQVSDVSFLWNDFPHGADMEYDLKHGLNQTLA